MTDFHERAFFVFIRLLFFNKQRQIPCLQADYRSLTDPGDKNVSHQPPAKPLSLYISFSQMVIHVLVRVISEPKRHSRETGIQAF